MPLLIDGLIILVYFAGIMAIGLYMGRREHSLSDFALGGRRIPWWAVMASIIAAETSAATFLGTPGEGFKDGTFWYVQLIIGLILGRVLVGFVFLKPYYDYRVYTVYDYLGARFGPISRNYVSALFLFMRTLASGTRMFLPALVMVIAWQHIVAGDKPTSFQAPQGVGGYVIAIVIITLLTCAYTAIGGIKAVIWTDVIQAILMFGSALVVIVTLLYHVAGDSFDFGKAFATIGRETPQLKTWGGYVQTGFEQHNINAYLAAHGLSEMTPWHYLLMLLGNKYTLLSATIGSMMLNMAAFGTDQDMVQRMLTAESHKKARRSLITAALMDLPIWSAFTFIGILLLIYFRAHPEFKPVDASGKVINKDVFGSYIMHVLPMGIRGVVLAGVFATAMGSLSAALNALATSATNDWYIRYFAKHKSDAHHVFAARVFTTIFAVLMIVIAGIFAYASVTDPNIRIIPVVLGVAGFILGPMLGVFLLGMLTRRRGSDLGNLVAISLGLISTTVLGGLHIHAANLLASALNLGKLYKMPKWLPTVEFTWYATVGAVVVFAVGLLFRTPDAVLSAARRQKEMAQQA